MVLSDIYASVNALDEMPTKETYWDVNETNGAMGFGGEATGTGSTPTYDFYGPINARNGVIGGTRYSTSEVDTGNSWIDGKRIYARVLTYTTPATENVTTRHPLDMRRFWFRPQTIMFILRDTWPAITVDSLWRCSISKTTRW